MTDTIPSEAETPKEPTFQMTPSRTFTPWLQSIGGSIAFTTYQAGKVFFLGINPENGRLSVFERSFPRCMGFGHHRENGNTTLWMSSLYQLWRIENFLEPGQKTEDGYDAVFVPVEGRTTGDIDIHDIHGQSGKAAPLFVATRFNCLATMDRMNSFAPVWKPPFIDRIAAEDRCHLNGLAMDGDRPAYVTCVSQTNTAGAWRDHRRDGGVILDVATGEPIISGLSMPHSPRMQNGQLYCLQSGTGEFGRIDVEAGEFEPMCQLPGFARGVAFIGNHALIGVSRPRRDKTFEGLEIQDRLANLGQSPSCMLAVVNLTTGDIEHSIEIEGVVQELYDVAFLQGIMRPKMLGFRTPEIRFQIRPAPMGELPNV